MNEFEASKKIVKKFMDGIRKEAKDVKDENLLRLGIVQALIYLDFLETIFSRYQENSQLYRENFKKLQSSFQRDGKSHTLTSEQEAMFEESSRLSLNVRLDIESFYLFSHILISKLTNFPERYFKHAFRRGLSCGSHNQFWQSMGKNKNFDVPKNLNDTTSWLTEKIVDYRDKIITHTFKAEHIDRMLLKGYMFDAEGSVVTTSNVLYPENEMPKNVNSEKLVDLIAKLNTYIKEYIEFLEQNADKSILSGV